MKILVDMNLSPRWVHLLQDDGFEASHWSEKGPPTATDAEIMAFAAAEDFVVLTHDLDFGAILAVTHGSKPSVVQIRSENLDPEFIGNNVLIALRQMQSDLESGALVTVDTRRTRLRVLPLFE
jgi:predicted nuclease of predicted toxin-antitoxin system